MANLPVSAPETKMQWVKTINPRCPDQDFYVPADDADTMRKLAEAPILAQGCVKACTSIVTLIPRTLVDVHSGIGSQKFNVDGYRTINAYVISDPLFSSTQRGFTLELSFGLTPGGYFNESYAFYNFETFFNPNASFQGTLICATSDLVTTGGVPWVGGNDLVHILRAPIMGPYVRASVSNGDSMAHNVEVQAYLST